MSEETTAEGLDRRRRGRRPADAAQRRKLVASALAELESARVPFSMADLAERAGISRATLYRDTALRDLIGSRGDGPVSRPVDTTAWRKLSRDASALKTERRELKRELAETKRRIAELEASVAALERECMDRMRAQREAERSGGDGERVRQEAYAEGFAAGTRAAASRGGTAKTLGASGLTIAASRLPQPKVIAARRKLARALHPDLFADDPAASLLATEILKQLNALAER